MKTKNLIIISCLSLFLLGCETTEKIDDFPLRPSQLVVNCYFHENAIFEFQVSKSLSVLDNADLKLVNDATVKLFKNNELLETLTEQSEDGWYRAENTRPETGEEYSIEVSSPDFEQVLLSTELAPQKVLISDVSVQVRDSSYYEYETGEGRKEYWGQAEGSFNITFSDPASFENFYALSVFFIDTMYYDYENPPRISVEKRNVSISSDDASIENDGDNYIKLLFRDLLFDGQAYQLKIDFEDWQARRGKEYFIELTSLQKGGYLYKRSIGDYYQARNDPFAEPVQIYSNIENGYGIFTGYSKAYYSISF